MFKSRGLNPDPELEMLHSIGKFLFSVWLDGLFFFIFYFLFYFLAGCRLAYHHDNAIQEC